MSKRLIGYLLTIAQQNQLTSMILYFIWAILNIVLGLFFLLLCFRAIRLIKEEYGRWATIVFIFGLIAFGCNSNKNEASVQDAKQWKFVSNDSLFQGNSKGADRFASIMIEEKGVCKHGLGIRYYKDFTTREKTILSAVTTNEGWTAGTKWTPVSVIVNSIADDKIEYDVNALEEWQLFNITFISRTKEYKGVAAL